MRSEDAQLISDFLAGESEAVQTIDGWISRAASSYRRRLAARWGDVLQDLRLEVTRLLRQNCFRGHSSLKTYLYRVISHGCLNHIKAAEKWQWTDLESIELEDRGRPPEQVGAGESKDLLLRVWREMPQECRRLWLMIVEGRSYQEMSQSLDVPEGALRVRVLRCRKKAVEFRRRSLEPQKGGNTPAVAAPNMMKGEG